MTHWKFVSPALLENRTAAYFADEGASEAPKVDVGVDELLMPTPAVQRSSAMFVHGSSHQLFRLLNSQDFGHAWASYVRVYDSRRESAFQQPHRAFSALNEEGLREHTDFWIP